MRAGLRQDLTEISQRNPQGGPVFNPNGSDTMHVMSVRTIGAIVLAGGLATHATAQRPGPNRGRFRTPDRIGQGDIAPNFTLNWLDGSGSVTLSDFRGKKPVALVFGSYT